MTAAAWHPDPTGQHELRYWDGSQWTEHVSDGGVVSTAPLHAPAQPQAHEAQPREAQPEAGMAAEMAATGEEPGSHDETSQEQSTEEASPFSDAALDQTVMAGDPLTDPMPEEQAEADAPADWDTPTATHAMPQASGPGAEDAAAPTHEASSPAYEAAPQAQPTYEATPPAFGAAPPAYVPEQQQFPAQDPYAQQPPMSQAPVGQAPMGQAPVGGAAYGDAFGGITGDLIDGRFSEVGDVPGPSLQNSKLLKVRVVEPFMAKQGSMVAYQGNVDFAYQGGGVGKFLKKAVTGEGLALMRVEGQGDVFLADTAANVHILRLNNSGLSVNGKNILAFSASLQWNIERVKGGSIAAGGLFNTTLRGTGWVAITTDGDPVVLNAQEAPTFADANALVAWSVHLQTGIKSSFTAGSLVGRGSGEAFQVTFSGPGFVIVQPSEGYVPPPTA